MSKIKNILNELNLNEMTKEEFMADAEKAIEYYKTEMTKLFPETKYMIRASLSTNLGASITYRLYNITEDENKAKNVNADNASVGYLFNSYMSNDFGQTVDKDKFEIKLLTQGNGSRSSSDITKFRKITAKTPLDACKKLVEWFKTNKNAIDSVPKSIIR